MRNQGIGSWAARRARMSPDRTAIVHDGHEWTYRELYERSLRMASALGVGHGDRVAYLGPNHPVFLQVMFATGMLGAIFVPLNTRLAAPELAYILRDSGASVVAFSPTHGEVISDLQSLVDIPMWLPAHDHVIPLTEPAEPAPHDEPTPRDEPVAPDEVGMIMYTSGTTGHPKGVALSHANIVANSMNLLIDVDLAGDEVTLVNAPMFHVAALNQTVLPTLLKGGTVVLDSAFDPVRTLELIERHRVTYLFGVPVMFQAIAATPQWESADLSSVRNLICGGAPVPEALVATYRERGLTFLQGYGLTESAPSALFLRAQDSQTKLGSAGTPCFNTDVRVVRPDGTDVGPGEPGEVILHGPNVMPGYWHRPDETAAVLSADGWLRTGDVAVADEDGYLYIRDRIKDMIISGGENIYPAEVEDVLYHHPAVAECAVIGVPDERWGEVGRAVVVLRAGATASPDELLGFLTGKIAKYKIPKSVVYTTALPRGGSGKILKAPLRASYGSGGVADGEVGR